MAKIWEDKAEKRKQPKSSKENMPNIAERLIQNRKTKI